MINKSKYPGFNWKKGDKMIGLEWTKTARENLHNFHSMCTAKHVMRHVCIGSWNWDLFAKTL